MGEDFWHERVKRSTNRLLKKLLEADRRQPLQETFCSAENGQCLFTQGFSHTPFLQQLVQLGMGGQATKTSDYTTTATGDSRDLQYCHLMWQSQWQVNRKGQQPLQPANQSTHQGFNTEVGGETVTVIYRQNMGLLGEQKCFLEKKKYT